MDLVQAFKLCLCSILGVIVLEQTTTLGVVAGDLQSERMSLTYHDVGGPDFNINRIHFTGNDGLDVSRVVVAVWQIFSVRGV
jgi:hypothetical protein